MEDGEIEEHEKDNHPHNNNSGLDNHADKKKIEGNSHPPTFEDHHN
jgi:hypothetical protein